TRLAEDLLAPPRSRAQLLKGAPVAAAGLGLVPAITSAASPRGGKPAGGITGRTIKEPVAEILNIAATAEALAVTAFYHVHVAVNEGKFNTGGIAIPVGTLVNVVRAILREEQDHLSFLMGAGGYPLQTKFTVPTDVLRSAVPALKFVEAAETIFVGAYMAANREFAWAGENALAQYSYQIGSVEAEHRTLSRVGLGQMPPNNKSFETNLFGKVADAAAELEKLGLLKPKYAYPGARAVNHILSTSFSENSTAGVTQRHP
ncbi:MAG: ferritin-like domain-containing protein, partial [Chloroflexota bacterium]